VFVEFVLLRSMWPHVYVICVFLVFLSVGDLFDLPSTHFFFFFFCNFSPLGQHLKLVRALFCCLSASGFLRLYFTITYTQTRKNYKGFLQFKYIIF
jgi:hypothetical protein